MQIKSNVEYKALEHEIAVVQQGIRALEDEEIAAMERMDELQRVLQEHGRDFQVEEQQVLQDLKTLDARAANIAGEIEQGRGAREVEAAAVAPDWRARYERVFERAGDYALVGVDKNCCGGCHMQLPPSVVHDARKGLSITLCNYCGRMLYASG
ncbi:MAG: C4-type zinc ribbon domain-containing protein [Kiritimatiellaeota bacterium]|nr:C4-type zinc ribbon domain-containing protein [Kiritimatiellota bacterium]